MWPLSVLTCWDRCQRAARMTSPPLARWWGSGLQSWPMIPTGRARTGAEPRPAPSIMASLTRPMVSRVTTATGSPKRLAWTLKSGNTLSDMYSCMSVYVHVCVCVPVCLYAYMYMCVCVCVCVMWYSVRTLQHCVSNNIILIMCVGVWQCCLATMMTNRVPVPPPHLLIHSCYSTWTKYNSHHTKASTTILLYHDSYVCQYKSIYNVDLEFDTCVNLWN